MFTDLSGIQASLIGLAVLVFVIVRQFRTRRVTNLFMILAPIVLTLIGLQGLAQMNATGWLLLGVNFSIAVALGLVRGTTFRVWVDEHHQALMRGTTLTLLVWVVTFVARIGLYVVEGQIGLGDMATGSAETMLPAAATLGAQLLVVYLRSRGLTVPDSA